MPTSWNTTAHEAPESWGADLDLVQRALENETDAVTLLTKRLKCVPRILAARNQRMGRPLDEHDLADTAQNALMIILRKLPTFEGRASIEGWVYRICSFEFLNMMRGKIRRAKPLDGLEETLASQSDAACDDPWRYEELYRALDRIPLEDSQVVRLKHLEELTFDQMAQRLGLPSSTAKARYYRGMEALSTMLDANGERKETQRISEQDQ